MHCPFCGYEDTQVKDSRPSEDGAAIRRRRFCPKCESRFTTFERVQIRELIVIKRNGERRPFDRDAQRLSGQEVIDAGEQLQPPVEQRRPMHLASRRRVVVVDGADPPFAARDHGLGLHDPMRGVLARLQQDHRTDATGVTRRRFRVGRRRIDHDAVTFAHLQDMPAAHDRVAEDERQHREGNRDPQEELELSWRRIAASGHREYMPPAFRRSQTIKPGSDADAEEGRKQAQRSEKEAPFS